MLHLLPNSPAGFRDRAGPAALLYEYSRTRILDQYRNRGATLINLSQVIAAEGVDAGTELAQQLYLLTKSGAANAASSRLAMRPEQTAQMVAFYAKNYRELPSQVRLAQSGIVYRGETPQKGRLNSFNQTDFDLIGSKSPYASAEVILCVKESLAALGVTKIQIGVNHRNLLSGFLSSLGVDAETEPKMLRIIDKYHKIGEQKTRKEIETLLNPETTQTIIEFLSIKTQLPFTQGIAAIKEFVASKSLSSPLLDQSFDELAKLGQVFELTGCSQVRLDQTIARGLSYYTGVVFETTLLESTGGGSISSGGAYDLGSFSERLQGKTAIGMSIGLDRLIELQPDLKLPQLLPPIISHTSPIGVCLTADGTANDKLFTIAERLRTLLRAPVVVFHDVTIKKLLKGEFFSQAEKAGCTTVLSQSAHNPEQLVLRDLSARKDILTMPVEIELANAVHKIGDNLPSEDSRDFTI